MQVIDADTLRARLSPIDLLGATREAFIAATEGRVRVTADVLDLDDGDVHVKAASEVDGALYAVKVASLIPSNRDRGLPPGGGAILVCSAATGEPLVLLIDDHYLTDARTAMAGALASDLLAPAKASRVAVLGSGEQARLQVTTLAELRGLDQVVVWARRTEAARSSADALRSALAGSVEVEVAANVRDAVDAAEILITATASPEPLVEGEWLHPGQHVSAIGADDDCKRELSTACFARADRIVVDLRAQTCAKAELAGALKEGVLDAERVVELGEILSGKATGRGSEDEITIAKLSGIAAQDLAAVKTVGDRLGLFA